MWTGVSASVPYETFDKQRHTLSEAPGVNQLGRLSKTPGLAYEQAIVSPNSTLPVKEIGYDYRVSFDIEGANEAMGTELFRSEDAVFYLSDPIRGMLGYARDGYLNTFTYPIQTGRRMSIAIEGDNKATRLFINGKQVEELNIQERWMDKEGKARIRNVRTLVFPLEKAGMGILSITLGYGLASIFDGTFQTAFFTTKQIMKGICFQELFTRIISRLFIQYMLQLIVAKRSGGILEIIVEKHLTTGI